MNRNVKDFECSKCCTTISVQWRNSPDGKRLCNKCGVYLSRHPPKPIIVKKRSRPRKQTRPLRSSFE